MSRLLHVDAIQESPEERSKTYINVRRVSTGGADAVVRHKRHGVGGSSRQTGGAVQEFA